MIEPKIMEVKKEIKCSGLMNKVNMKNVYKMVPKLLDDYRKRCGENLNPNLKRPWQYISLSSNYQGNMSWDYYTGHVVNGFENEPEGLTHYEVPKGDYAVFEIREKSAMFFSIKMGRIKKYIYNEWIPKSKYNFSGYEFEYNDESMKQRNPNDVDLYVGIKEKS